MATFPKAPSTDFTATSLNGSINDTTTTIEVNDASALQYPSYAVIDREDANGNATATAREVVKITNISSNTLTCTRGVNGSTNRSHNDAALFEPMMTVGLWDDTYDTFDVEHSCADGTHDATLVAMLAGDQTVTGTKTFGSGKLVATSAALTTPVLTTSVSGTAIATATEVATGTDNTQICTPLSVAPYAYHSMARQAIINGNFDVWQRGTSVAMTAANAYTADRWYCETATAGTDKTVSRQDGTGVNGSYYCARVAMVQDQDELLTFSQALESQDSIKFRGQKVTLSFYARGGAEFVSDNATLVSKIVTGKGTDEKVLAFTTSADAVSQNNTLTTSWVRFTCTTSAVIAADITQIGVSFAFTHAGSGTTTNYFEVTQVQLCAGDVALPFEPKSYEQELQACQRYAFVITTSDAYQYLGIGYNSSTTRALPLITFPTIMRTIPTLTATAADWEVEQAAGAIACSAVAISDVLDSTRSAVLLADVASGLTAGQGSAFRADGTAGRIMKFDAEL